MLINVQNVRCYSGMLRKGCQYKEKNFIVSENAHYIKQRVCFYRFIDFIHKICRKLKEILQNLLTSGEMYDII